VTVYQFTFSNKPNTRLLRHLSFWIFYYIYTLLINLPGINSKILSDPEFYKSASLEALYYLPVYLFSVYFSLYFVMPRFLAKRNFIFLLISFFTLLLITYTGSYLITRYIVFDHVPADPQDILTVSMIKGVSEQIIITGSALSIKAITYYYQRDEEYQNLSIQRIYHQLDMMKMKLEPAILLGALKNIHLDINNGSKNAPKMILQLSELLSYILYEADVKQVPLKKEINMLQDYASLKKLIFGSRWKAEVRISGDIDHQMITPLVLLPFLELALPQEIQHADEHYSSGIDILMNESVFLFTAESNLPFPGNGNRVSAKMLENALQNLRVKYPDRHVFRLEEIENGFTVYLELKLNTVQAAHLNPAIG
jgi:sensor histidine kinase YesM